MDLVVQMDLVDRTAKPHLVVLVSLVGLVGLVGLEGLEGQVVLVDQEDRMVLKPITDPAIRVVQMVLEGQMGLADRADRVDQVVQEDREDLEAPIRRVALGDLMVLEARMAQVG